MSRDYAITISSYSESEHDVLELRNRNRPEPKSKAYMDWRYLGQPSIRPPVIFKTHAPDGSCIGMAGVIFRPYYLSGQKLHVAVVGDISLDAEYRGRGLATRMIHRMNAYFKEQEIPLAWVIPTEPARKIFSACGWQTKGALAPLVLLLDAQEKLLALTRSKTIATLAGTTFNKINLIKIASISTTGFGIKEIKKLDSSFDLFWDAYNKKNIFIGDKSTSFLNWRYISYPSERFSMFAISRNDIMSGYLACRFTAEKKECTIYDFLMTEQSHVKPAMALFIKSILKTAAPSSIRLTLNESNLYTNSLKFIGFSKRRKVSDYQIYNPGKIPVDLYHWFLSSADKDV